MITKFNQYIKESKSVRDLMTPKPMDDILKSLDKLSDNEKIEKIIKYGLPFELLPRNEKGICIYNGSLYCSNNQLTSLPDNLIVKGDLYCHNNQLTSLPDNLIVKGDLNCFNNQLTSLPDNLVVKGDLNCFNNQLTSLPDNLVVKGDLWCNNNQLTSLSDNLVVNGSLDCRDNPLPKDTKKPKGVKGKLILF
jgi:hypothetical protein